ncbi:hypothetical protein DP106_14200 [Halonotius pteroides]|uniref:Uncharacterized protein n=1 Tax=Halonotius pteroides TaxID=268735 RepID=A0A3A6QB22_9EURY|nr:hypothetical protein DP106_14200 [Halonotius pteroides]
MPATFDGWPTGHRRCRHPQRADDRTVVASGTSCLDQRDDLLQQPPKHPIELLAGSDDRTG